MEKGIRFRDIFPMIRISALSKTILIVLLGVYLSKGSWDYKTLIVVVLATLLWAMLYALNELSDLEAEQNREIPSKIFWLVGLIIIGLIGVSATLSYQFSFLMTGMAFSQVLYSIYPFRLKRFWQFPVLFTGIINPILRIECGGILGSEAIPFLAPIALCGLHLGAAIKTRFLQFYRDKEFKYHPAPPSIFRYGAYSSLVGIIALFLLCEQEKLPHFVYFYVYGGFVYIIWFWFCRGFMRRNIKAFWPVLGLMLLAACIGLILSK